MKALLYLTDGRIKEIEVPSTETTFTFVDFESNTWLCMMVIGGSSVNWYVAKGLDPNFLRDKAEKLKKSQPWNNEYYAELHKIADRIEDLPAVWPTPKSTYIEAKPVATNHSSDAPPYSFTPKSTYVEAKPVIKFNNEPLQWAVTSVAPVSIAPSWTQQPQVAPEIPLKKPQKVEPKTEPIIEIVGEVKERMFVIGE